MSSTGVSEPTEQGRELRRSTPRSAHADWAPAPGRPDPVALIEEQNESRVPWLVPIRHARMSVSPFTFYRGAARIMASDLATTPSSGLTVQLAGDAHLSNFGAYASPERRLVFDQNDFDETLPGPWEWDLKRLATSFVVACQFHGHPAKAARSVAAEAVRSYREAMARFADQSYLELWYHHIDVATVGTNSGLPAPELEQRLERFRRRATRKTSQHALEKLAEVVDGKWRIRYDPPVLFPLDHLPGNEDQEALRASVLNSLASYRSTLDDSRIALFDRYQLVDVAVKVVGVGSVGTRCLIALLRGRDERDPLFLQVKEAGPSVLAEHLPPSRYEHQGQRVVEGQRLVQATSDIFLGWTSGEISNVDFYVRQLRDWKGSVDIEADGITPDQLRFYAGLCGLTLARGHARSGDAAAIASYAGAGTRLDRAIAAFAESYASQNVEDFTRFREAIESGRLPCADEAV